MPLINLTEEQLWSRLISSLLATHPSGFLSIHKMLKPSEPRIIKEVRRINNIFIENGKFDTSKLDAITDSYLNANIKSPFKLLKEIE